MFSSTALSSNALVLVTGAGGYVGSAVSWQLLKQGFKVRGTTRTASKLDLFKQKADKEFGAGKFEVVEVADLTVKGALDEALRGVEGVINVASDTTFGDDLQKVVGTVTSLTEEVLSSVQAAGNVKAFVTTSSRVAAFNSDGKSSYKIDDTNWWDEAYELAEKSQDGSKGYYVYSASKVAGEKAIWSFVEKQKPTFRVNAVLPDLVLGAIRNPAPGNYSTGSGLLAFADEKPGFLELLFGNPSWFVDVEDAAKLHVAALLDPSVDKKRLWAASGPFSADKIQEAVKAAKPGYKGKDFSHFPGVQDIVIDNKSSIDLLQKHYQHGFKDLKQAVKETIVGV